MRSITEQNLNLKLSLEEVFKIHEACERSLIAEKIIDRLEEQMSIFYNSKPNILDYPIEEWHIIESIFKFCKEKNHDK